MPYQTRYSHDSTDQQIRQKFLGAKFGKYVTCDHCGSDRVYQNKDKNVPRCRNCWSSFSLTGHTHIANAKLDLRFWYEVIWSFVIGHSANKAYKLLGTKRH
ncbi:MAG: hypothetical protein ACLFVS_07500 [Candidatus Acetothermia bacterium]